MLKVYNFEIFGHGPYIYMYTYIIRIHKTRGVHGHGIVQRIENPDPPPPGLRPAQMQSSATFLKLYIVSRNVKVHIEVFSKPRYKNLK